MPLCVAIGCNFQLKGNMVFTAFLEIKTGENNGKMLVDEHNFLKSHIFVLATSALIILKHLADHS